MPRQHKSLHRDEDGPSRTEDRKLSATKRKTKATTAEESLSKFVESAHKNHKSLEPSPHQRQYGLFSPHATSDDDSGASDTSASPCSSNDEEYKNHLAAPSWKTGSSKHTLHDCSTSESSDSDSPNNLRNDSSRNAQKLYKHKNGRSRRRISTSSTKWSFFPDVDYKSLYVRLKLLTFFGLSGWILVMVILASLVLLTWASPWIQRLWRGVLYLVWIFDWLMTLPTGLSTQINRFSPNWSPTFCSMPVVSNIRWCNDLSPAKPSSDSLKNSIALLSDDPGNFHYATRLLDDFSYDLSPLVHAVPYGAAHELLDHVSRLSILISGYDNEHDRLLRKVSRSSSEIVSDYSKLVSRKWYNSLPPIAYWVIGNFVWEEFQQDIESSLDAWIRILTTLDAMADDLVRTCNSTLSQTEKLKRQAKVNMRGSQQEQGFWMLYVKTPVTIAQEELVDIIKTDKQILDSVIQAFRIFEATKTSIGKARYGLEQAKTRFTIPDHNLWIKFRIRITMNRDILDEFREAATASNLALSIRDDLYSALESKLETEKSTVKTKRIG